MPYFLRDNKGIVDEILGISNGKKTPQEIAAEHHAKRTAADVEQIQTDWNQRLLNNLASQTERIGSFRDKEMLEWIQILQDEVDIKRFDFFSKDYAKAKAYLEKRISKETEAAKAFMATKANAENMKALAKALGVEQGELMTFFEADEMRSNPNFAVAEMYRVNCQTCVVANELRRRGFNIQALGNFKGSKSEELSKFTNGIWQKADGNIPNKIRIGAEFNQWSYIDPSGKRHKKGFSKTVPNRKRLVSELEANLSEDGRYHIDWTWKSSGKKRTGHIITVEKIGDTIRYYDPQTGKVISDFTEYIKEIDLSRGINLLRVDNLRVKPGYAADILAKGGTKATTGNTSVIGITGNPKSIAKIKELKATERTIEEAQRLQRWEENHSRYQKLKENEDYSNVVFDEETGGLKALHRGHIIHSNPNDELFFGKYTSTQLEMRCQDILFKNGFSCILEDETKFNPVTKNQLSLLDTRTNDEYMDIKAITQNNHGTIKNALTSKKDQLRRFNEQNDETASSVILYFEDPTYFNESKVRKNIGGRLKKVICVLNTGGKGVVLEIKK
ncbi:MAG: toxin glutamine deamidase domain-containing protein [Lepagella sp.]